MYNIFDKFMRLFENALCVLFAGVALASFGFFGGYLIMEVYMMLT